MVPIGAVLFSVWSTVYIVHLVKGFPGRDASDFAPDYPGGCAVIAWVVVNALVWMAAVRFC